LRGQSIHLLSGDRLAVDVERTQALAKRWPRARTTWLNQSGHNPIIEDPTGLSAHFKGLLAVD
jgi:pimeloyl-ACP methyl ester carboxylesterase